MTEKERERRRERREGEREPFSSFEVTLSGSAQIKCVTELLIVEQY
jgi:hypothetical protein